MSTIFLDPVQMDATAGHVGEHVTELTTLTADLETACSAAVPTSIAGWLAEELHDIALTARMIALLYTVAALDTAQRAQQIQADQSLATAVPALASTTPTFTGAPLVGGIAPFATSTAATGFLAGSSIPSGFVLGQVDTSFSVPVFGQPQGLMLGASGPNTPLGGYTPGLGGGSQVHWGWNSSIAHSLAPRGLSALAPNVFEDQYGHQGTINQTVRDPLTGDAEF